MIAYFLSILTDDGFYLKLVVIEIFEESSPRTKNSHICNMHFEISECTHQFHLESYTGLRTENQNAASSNQNFLPLRLQILNDISKGLQITANFDDI